MTKGPLQQHRYPSARIALAAVSPLVIPFAACVDRPTEPFVPIAAPSMEYVVTDGPNVLDPVAGAYFTDAEGEWAVFQGGFGGDQQPYRWSAASGLQPLYVGERDPLDGWVIAGVNRSGEAVGYHYINSMNNIEAIRWQSDGRAYTSLSQGDWAVDINDAGDIVLLAGDYTAPRIRLADGSIAPLSVPEGYVQVLPRWINNAGQVAGSALWPGQHVAVLWLDAATPVVIPPDNGHAQSAVEFLAEDGTLVVHSFTDWDIDGRTYLWSVGGVREIPTPSPYTSLRLRAIDSYGRMVGSVTDREGSITPVVISPDLTLQTLAAPSVQAFAGGVTEAGLVAGSALAANGWVGLVWKLGEFYAFDGFRSPITNEPAVSVAPGGRAIPVRFSLGGDMGLDIFAAPPASRPFDCSGDLAETAVDETFGSGNSTLSYDAAADEYSFVWKTEKGWAGTCRQLVVDLRDGTRHTARFRFR